MFFIVNSIIDLLQWDLSPQAVPISAVFKHFIFHCKRNIWYKHWLYNLSDYLRLGYNTATGNFKHTGATLVRIIEAGNHSMKSKQMYTNCCSTTARKRSSRHLFLKCRKYVIRTLCLRSICMAINDNQLASIISDCSRLLWCHTQVFPIAFETKTGTSLGGLEPPTFRLTAERANRLRHRDGTSVQFEDENLDILMDLPVKIHSCSCPRMIVYSKRRIPR